MFCCSIFEHLRYAQTSPKILMQPISAKAITINVLNQHTQNILKQSRHSGDILR